MFTSIILLAAAALAQQPAQDAAARIQWAQSRAAIERRAQHREIECAQPVVAPPATVAPANARLRLATVVAAIAEGRR